jgi:hypothetical protein
MKSGTTIAMLVALLSALVVPASTNAQLPGGVTIPGGVSLPTGGLSKDGLLTQAKQLVSELTSMKDSGKLQPDQAQQVDELLPKANSLTGELGQSQVDVTKLPKLASDLNDLQKQLGMLKGLMK